MGVVAATPTAAKVAAQRVAIDGQVKCVFVKCQMTLASSGHESTTKFERATTNA